jgi:ATP-dependent exoDNAse (exonuclease V) beta subunit
MSHVPSTLILASAGTGKTFALSSRYIELLERGVSPSRILATTFTRQAAGEILDRVLQRLLERRDSTALRAMLQNVERVRVSTLDSLFSQIAAGSATDVGLPPGWKIVEEDEDERLRAAAVENALRDGERGDLLTMLRLMMAKRFSSKVAAEMLERVEEAHAVYRSAPEEAWGVIDVPADLRALEAREIRECIEGWNAVPLARVKDGSKPVAAWQNAHAKAGEAIESGDWVGFLKSGIAGKLLEGAMDFSRAPIPDAVIAAYDPLIRHARWTLLTNHVRGTHALRELLARFDVAYTALKERHRAYRFDDVPRALAEEKGLTLDEIAFRLDGAIDHVLLDEFQDTSTTQFALLEPLLSEILSGGGGRDEAPEARSVLCVGDLKQSLYQWRDAEPALFGALGTRWPQMERVGLHVSYRSSQVVLDAVNQVFTTIASSAAMDRFAAAGEQWQDAFVAHKSAPTLRDVPGMMRLSVAPRGDAGETQKVCTLRAAAVRVAQMVKECPGLSVGVLVRGKKAIPRIIFELKRLGVDASEEGGNPLTDSPAVAAALSALQLADHPGDTAAAFHVATSPMSEVVGLTGWTDEEARLRVAEAIRVRAMEGFGSLLEFWLEKLAPSCDARDVRRFEQLIELATAFDARKDARAENFVKMVRSKHVEDPASHPVQVLTIHKSKGLEYDAVVLPDLDGPLGGKAKGILWRRRDPFGKIDLVTRYPNELMRSLDPRLDAAYEENRARSVSEELCVLYVAMTRARRCLDIIVPPDPQSRKSVPSTLASVVTQAFAPDAPMPLEPGELLRTGDEDWMRGLARAIEAAPAPTLRVSLSRGRSPARMGRHRPPSGGSHGVAAASGRDGGVTPATNADQQPQVRDAGTRRATDRGELLHRWAQEISWLDEEVQATDEHLIAIARTMGLDPSIDVRGEMAWFRKSMQSPEIRGALSRDRYQEAAVDLRREVPFAMTVIASGTSQLLTGRIDRLVLCSDGGGRLVRAEVLDVKSDRVAGPEDVVRLAEAYRPQMESYSLATQRLTGLEDGQIKATLLFLAAGRVVEIAAKA